MKNIDLRQGDAVAITHDYDDFKSYLKNHLKIKE
jgi:hypothetical protein